MAIRRAILGLAVASAGVLALSPMAPASGPAFPGPSLGMPTTTAVQPLGFGAPSPVLMPRMNQSVSMSYATDGTRSVSQSMYMNEMSWRLSDPLTLHLDLGLLAPLWSSGPQSMALREQTPVILPRLGLEWRPSSSTFVSLSVAQSPLASSWTDPWRSTGSGSFAP